MTGCRLSDGYQKFNATMIEMDGCFDRAQRTATNPCQLCANEYVNLTQAVEDIKSVNAAVCFDIEDGVR